MESPTAILFSELESLLNRAPQVVAKPLSHLERPLTDMTSEGSARRSRILYVGLVLVGGLLVLLSIRDDVSILVAAIGTVISAYSIFKIYGLDLGRS